MPVLGQRPGAGYLPVTLGKTLGRLGALSKNPSASPARKDVGLSVFLSLVSTADVTPTVTEQATPGAFLSQLSCTIAGLLKTGCLLTDTAMVVLCLPGR